MLVRQQSGVAVLPQAFAASGLDNVRYLAIQETASESLAHFVWRRNDDDPALQRFVRHVRDWSDQSRESSHRRPRTL